MPLDPGHDLHGTTRQLELLARDRRLLHELRTNALATARGWPGWDQSSQFMALALRRVAEDPPPDPNRAALTSGTPSSRAAVLDEHWHLLRGQAWEELCRRGVPPIRGPLAISWR